MLFIITVLRLHIQQNIQAAKRAYRQSENINKAEGFILQ